MDIGKKIQELRKISKLTQVELSVRGVLEAR
jgi:hypothetical protein